MLKIRAKLQIIPPNAQQRSAPLAVTNDIALKNEKKKIKKYFSGDPKGGRTWHNAPRKYTPG